MLGGFDMPYQWLLLTIRPKVNTQSSLSRRADLSLFAEDDGGFVGLTAVERTDGAGIKDS